MPVNTTIQIRKGTSSEWNDANPVLALGEPGYDSTNGIFKIGDGNTPWNDLRPINETYNKQTFNVTGSQSEFVINNGYVIGSIDVYYNGVKLINGTDYAATNGTSIILTSPAINGSIIETINILPSLSFKNFVQSENIHPFLFSGM
jgi:hypothetical protein